LKKNEFNLSPRDYIFPFIFGIIATQKLHIFGEVYVGEILSLIYLVLNFSKIQFSKAEKTLSLFAFLWSFSQIISDLVNYSDINAFIKGASAPILFAVTIASLISYFRFQTYNNLALLKIRFFYFILGIELAGLIAEYFFPSEYSQLNLWKWGLGPHVLIIIIAWSSFYVKNIRMMTLFAAVFLFSFISFHYASRGLASIPLFSALIYALITQTKLKSIFERTSRVKRFLFFFFLVVISVISLNTVYSKIIKSDTYINNTSSDVVDKFSSQDQGKYGGVFGARPEIFVSYQAFFDKPLLGHGSWAIDNSGKYLREYYEVISDLGYAKYDNDFDLGNLEFIPTHSYMMQAFVWGGILAGLFWVYLLYFLAKSFNDHITRLPYFFYFVYFQMAFNICFSPFGADARWLSAILISAYITYLNQLNSSIRKV